MTVASSPARDRLSRTDWIRIAIWVGLAIASIVIVARYFEAAFPEAAIDFEYDRNSSKPVAEQLARITGANLDAMKHAARFESDHSARIFLERTLGLEEANRVLGEQVLVWFWRHRWFEPLIEEEVTVDVAPTGEIVSFQHVIPEERPIGGAPNVRIARAFLTRIGVDAARVRLVDESERRLPRRMQRIFTFESTTVRPADAPYRHTVIIDGNTVTGYSQRLVVPDAWLRSYRELRSKNLAAGSIDMILMVGVMIAAVIIFIARLRRGDLPHRFLLGIGIAGLLLVGGVALNSVPAQLSYYDTTTSYAAFVGGIGLQAALQSIGTAMMLIIICGAGEVLYRERLPRQLAMPRVWTPKALTSKRVFISLVVGYALVPLFMAYQALFYLGARRFGAWAPAEVPYSDILNSAFPWVAVLFAGFFPAFSEEFLSRAFAIPFFQRILHSRMTAIVVAGFIWGFGHATYPNQPFWIRGVEVGIAGIVAGLLMDRFGLLPLLIWHYTIDAVYTATLLFTSGNTYYVVTAAVASLIFVIPLIASISLYVRNRGFVPDDDLTNAAMPTAPAPPAPEPAAAEGAPLPPPVKLTRRRVLICVAAVVAAGIAFAFRPRSPSDAIDYRLTKEQAKQIASVLAAGDQTRYTHVVAAPVPGFRSWDGESHREEGGAPGDFDEVAATYLVRNGVSVRELIDVFRHQIEAGTWMVRFFTPLQSEELYVEVDPRDGRVVGHHKYQDEANPGGSLPQAQALAIARRAFIAFDVDVRQFALQDALSFQQPNRRDWLFHFQEQTPIAASAYRRVSVRVAGAEVTQFNKTVRVPDSVYREAETQTILNIVLFAMKIAGMVALLSIVIAGLIIVTRAHRLRWSRALRWTAVLSLIPIAGFVARYELMLFAYNTSVAWETFRVGLVTAFVRDVGLQVGIMFLAVAALDAVVPYAPAVLRREGRARLGASAAIAAVTAVAIVITASVFARVVAHAVPAAASVGISVPEQAAIPLPALVDGAQALFGAILVSAAVGLYSVPLRKRMAAVTIIAIFCATLDPLATESQVPMMLAGAAGIALLAWLLARYVLGGNPLAWPLAVFTAVSLNTAAALLQNSRPDLIANGLALIAAILAALAWAAWPRWTRTSARTPTMPQA